MATEFSTLPGLFAYATGHFNLERALMYPDVGVWRTWSTAAFRERVRWLTLGMHAIGVKPGDSVGILAPSSPEWIFLDLAVTCLGAVSVPLFKRISVESLRHEISDSGMQYLFVGNLEELPNIKAAKSEIREQITFGKGFPSDRFNEIVRKGREIDIESPQLFSELSSAVSEDDLATIIYTSGSTGLPKGVELTHRNIITQVTQPERDSKTDATTACSRSCLSHTSLSEW